MKSLTLRSSIALVCALSLAGCGGGSGNLLLAGSVLGLTKDGLVLANGNDTVAVPAGSLTFSFPQLLATDSSYNVTVKTQPTAAVCTVTNGTGNSGAFNVTSVLVNCVTNSYDLGGTITGLTRTGLVLVNGRDQKAIPVGTTATTTFTMTQTPANGTVTGKVADGSPYGVTILTQPTGQTCTVTNGVGTMGSSAVNSIQVSCV
jgi:hypothetical protein